MSNYKSQWLTVGSVKKSKNSEGSYLDISVDIELKKGDKLILQNPREVLAKSLESGRITEEQYQERLAKIPDYIIRTVVLPPKQG